MTAHSLAEAVQPLVRAIGATIVPLDEATDGDLVLSWEGAPALAVRLDMAETLGAMIASVESEFGAPLQDLPRTGKQAAVRVLAERGAFTLRKAIDEVADAMGVSRITIYNYLNAIRGDQENP